MGPHPNQKQALNLSAVFAEAWVPDRRRLGARQTVFFKFNTKYLCGIGVGSRFDADSHIVGVVRPALHLVAVRGRAGRPLAQLGGPPHPPGPARWARPATGPMSLPFSGRMESRRRHTR